jgi:hypothetical protein
MSLKEALKNILDADQVVEIMKIANSAQRKYIATQGGKDARSRANLKYRSKVVQTDPQLVKDQLVKYKEENPNCDCEIVTTLWKHYNMDALVKVTRKQYQTLLNQTEVEVKNPHWRNGCKYYADGYDLSS